VTSGAPRRCSHCLGGGLSWTSISSRERRWYLNDLEQEAVPGLSLMLAETGVPSDSGEPMSKRPRRNHTPAFKAKMALAAIKGASASNTRGSGHGMAQDHWYRIEKARHRLVLCRLMMDIMRSVHGTYAPVSEPFGPRLETFFVGVCVAIGDMEGKPFSVAKIAAYMHVPRTTVIRRLDRLQSWGVIDRRGRHYHMHEKTLNALIGMRNYQQVRRFLSKATDELTVLDTLAD
jgi:hypothetical protein